MIEFCRSGFDGLRPKGPMPTSALPRISVRADVGIGPYELKSPNPNLKNTSSCIFFIPPIKEELYYEGKGAPG